jgi:hypothetical protein
VEKYEKQKRRKEEWREGSRYIYVERERKRERNQNF